MTVLVSAASEHGATREIAEAIARTLRAHRLEVVVLLRGDFRDWPEIELRSDGIAESLAGSSRS